MMIPLILLAFSGVSAELVLDGLDKPTGIAFADKRRMVVLEKDTGKIHIAVDGVLRAKPFLTVPVAGTTWHGEAGLLGISFDPQYKRNRYFYVHYVGQDGSTIIDRYRAKKKNKAKANSRTEVLRIPRTDRGHYGGAIHFGPDGMLYAQIGCPWRGNCQFEDNYFGKLLRIDVQTFAVEIAALGLRNPWQGAWDDAGNLWIGDVGGDCFEELNRVSLAELYGAEPVNFGWGWNAQTGSTGYAEGTHCMAVDGLTCEAAALTSCGDNFHAPVVDYDHVEGRAIIGGRMSGGLYYFADYFQRFWALDPETGEVTDISAETGRHFVTAFGQDRQGRVYFTDFVRGEVYRLIP